MFGMSRSIRTTSGSRRRAVATASEPSAASPTTSMSSSRSKKVRRPIRTTAWSSTMQDADRDGSVTVGSRGGTRDVRMRRCAGYGAVESSKGPSPDRSRLPARCGPRGPLRGRRDRRVGTSSGVASSTAARAAVVDESGLAQLSRSFAGRGAEPSRRSSPTSGSGQMGVDDDDVGRGGSPQGRAGSSAGRRRRPPRPCRARPRAGQVAHLPDPPVAIDDQDAEGAGQSGSSMPSDRCVRRRPSQPRYRPSPSPPMDERGATTTSSSRIGRPRRSAPRPMAIRGGRRVRHDRPRPACRSRAGSSPPSHHRSCSARARIPPAPGAHVGTRAGSNPLPSSHERQTDAWSAGRAQADLASARVLHDVVQGLLGDPVERLLGVEREALRSVAREHDGRPIGPGRRPRGLATRGPGRRRRGCRAGTRRSVTASRPGPRAVARGAGQLGAHPPGRGHEELHAACDQGHREQRLGHRVVELRARWPRSSLAASAAAWRRGRAPAAAVR